jgi:serine/threonine protein kinase
VDIPKLIGRYEIVDRVARGGMGALYRARDPVLEREVAIKVMLADFSHDAIGRARFYREARAVARLQHRNIVTLFDFGEDEGSPFIVMEYLRGQTLGQRRKHGPPVPLEEALSIGSQLCTGLHFAHAHGVVHRDVKPANIWLLEDGGVKLLDFGIAKYGDTDVTQVGDVLGSVSYMSPEQLSGTGIDGRSDIFSAGIVLYELLSGHRPFMGESPTAIMMKIIHEEPTPLDAVPGAPPKLRTLIGRALEKSPEKRYQHAAEFASELRELQMVVERQHDTGSSASSGKTSSPATLSATVADVVPDGWGSQESRRGPDGWEGREVRDVRQAREATPSAPAPPPQPETLPPAGPAFAVPNRAAPERAGKTRAAARDAMDAVALHQAAPAAAFDLESYDPAGDMLIGDNGQHHHEIDAPPAAFETHTAPSSGAARAWLPAGAAIGAIAIALVTFLLVRGESTEVTSGAVSNVADSSGKGSSPGSPGTPGAPGGKGDGVGPAASPPAYRGTPPDGGRETPANGSATPGGRDMTRAGTEPSRPGAGTPTTPTPPIKGGPPANTSKPSVPNGVPVILTAAYPFDVMGDAGVISKARTRHELTLANGQALRLRSAEYCFDRRVTVEAKGGAAFKMQMPALGRITVRTPYETCRVSLGGYPLGYPPISERPVASGTYRLTLTCPDGDNQVESVTISPGQTQVALIR